MGIFGDRLRHQVQVGAVRHTDLGTVARHDLVNVVAFQDRREHQREQHQVVVLDPYAVARAQHRAHGLGKALVRLAVRQPVFLVKVHLAGVVVEERPEDRVREAIVVPLGKLVRNPHGLALVLFAQRRLDVGDAAQRHTQPWPADPRKVHGFLCPAQGRDESAGRLAKRKAARHARIHLDRDRQPVGNDHQPLCRLRHDGLWRSGPGR